MRPFLNGLELEIVSVGISSTPLTSWTTARSPVDVPAKTRLPDAKTTSGLSVRGSMTTSPRIPCALRISPTIAYSGSAILKRALRAGRRCFVRLLADRNGHDFALDAESLLMPPLEDAGAPEERPYGVSRLGAQVEPVIGSRFVHLERALALAGSVLADDLDELPVAGTLRVGDENAVERRIFPPNAAKANLYHLRTAPLCGDMVE